MLRSEIVLKFKVVEGLVFIPAQDYVRITNGALRYQL